jgi:hypothetical protein
MRTDFERDELQRFDRIARLGRAVEIGSRVLVGTAAAACAVVLVGRVLGVWMPPSAWWALGLAPALVATAVTFLRPRDTRGDAAILDRRFGLHGLLMVSAENAENDLGGWRPDLGDRLARVAPRARPSLAAKNASIRSGVAAVLVAAIAFLGPLSAGIGGAGRPASVAMQDAIERTAGEIELARDDGALDEERGEELTQRADAMRERLLSGDDVAWSEVDLLREELAHEQAARRNALRALAESAAELSGDEADAESGRQAAELAARAAEAGLLDAVPEQTREELARALAEAMRESAGSQGAESAAGSPGTESLQALARSLGLDGAALGQGMPPLDLDEELLKRLAEACRDGALGEMQRLADLDRLPPIDREALKRLLERREARPPGEKKPGECKGGSCDGSCSGGACRGGLLAQLPGRGGVTRGPGAAPLEMTGDTDADTSAATPQRLAPGQAIPDRWMTLGVSRAAPDVAPERADAASGGAAAPDGTGRATWSRSLAPRHREAVRRYFSER